MIDIRELERRWLRYKIKHYLPYVILLFSVILIALILSSITLSSSKEETPTKKQPEKVEKTNTTNPALQIQQEKPNSTHVVQPKKPQTNHQVQTNKENIALQAQPPAKKQTNQPKENPNDRVIEPSFDFLGKMKDNAVIPEVQIPKEDKQPPNSEITEQTPDTMQTSSPKRSEHSTTNLQQSQIQAQKKPAKLEIRTKKISKKELQSVIDRFKKNNNPALGVFIAKKYYELGEYHKSYNYALITNQINSSIEESWIIFAKSLVKLGRKDQAIKTLQAYIKTSNSSKAQILLDNIRTGKFK